MYGKQPQQNETEKCHFPRADGIDLMKVIDALLRPYFNGKHYIPTNMSCIFSNVRVSFPSQPH